MPNRISPICFGRADIDRAAGELVDLGLEAGGFLGEFAGQPRQHLAVDRNAAPLHLRQHAQQRPLQRLVDVEHVLGGKPGFEHLPQPQRHVGILGGVFGRLVDFDAVERDLGLAGLGHLVEVDGLVIEVAPRQGIEAVIGTAGVDHVGHQHGVVVGRDLDAAHGENLPVEFQILADLEHAGIFQQRLDGIERGAFGNLIGRDLALEQAATAAVAALAVD